jgi:hypothetical protein
MRNYFVPVSGMTMGSVDLRDVDWVLTNRITESHREHYLCSTTLTWAMVTDAEGQITHAITLPNKASKGRGGGRLITLNLTLHAALAALHQLCGDEVHPDRPVIASERGGSLTASSVTKGVFHLSQDLGMTGCSSHSGRRTFRTRAARKVSEVGGSVRQVRTAVTAD